MNHLTLIRSYLPDRTIGQMDGFATLERPWLDNQPDVSCIPEGTYTVKRDTVGRHQWFSVQDVVGRTFIEFHEGTKPSHSNGCILISSRRDITTLIWDDSEALEELVVSNPNGFILTIRQFNPSTDKWVV